MPGRRREMLKAHARFRDYVQEKISCVNFGPEVEAFVKRDSILNNLKNISEQIQKKRCFHHLDKQAGFERKKINLARKIVDPAEDHKETKAVETWFASSEHEAEEEKNMKTYEKSMAERKVSSKDFNSFAVWAKFTLSAVDKSRRGAYNFTNEDFAAREPKWLPDGNINDDDTDVIEMIPDGWNPSKAPEEGMEASCWVVRVPGDRKGMKLRRNADVVLTKKVLGICLKYQDLKEIVFDNIDITEPFFVNYKGKPVGEIQRVKGSLLEKMGKATGIGKLTTNSFRRAAEKTVQGSPKLKEHIQVLQSHSTEVGAKHYYRTGDDVRAQFINRLSEKETPKAYKDDVSEDVKKRREKLESKQKESILKKAKDKLLEDKMKKNIKYKLKPNDRSFLQNVFVSNVRIKNTSTFPGSDFSF